MEFKLFDSLEEMKTALQNKKPRLVRASDRNICVVRVQDRLIAFENECPHMGESLHQGSINYLNEIVCPLHSYRFNTNTGESNKECSSLKLLKVNLKENGVYLIL